MFFCFYLLEIKIPTMKITEQELQELIKEEAKRLRKRMMLESERKSILKKLQEIEECDMMAEDMGDEITPTSAPAEEPAPEAAQKVEKRTNAIMSHVSPGIQDKAMKELQAGGFLGASQEEIKAKIAEMLPMNESLIGEAFNKSTLYNWLVGAGLGATLAGLTATVIGSLDTAELSNLADYTGATVTPSASVIAGLVATALGVISMAVGKHGKSSLDAEKNTIDQVMADKIIAARKARLGR